MRFDNLIMSTQVHEGEEPKQSVVVAIEEALKQYPCFHTHFLKEEKRECFLQNTP